MPALKSAAATVTLKHLAAQLAKRNKLTKKQTQQLLDEFVALIQITLKKGSRVRISGLGILRVRQLAARMGRNPKTGEPVQIKASKKIAFRAAKDLKEAVRR
jgi:DNA-binding protein HU-beta